MVSLLLPVIYLAFISLGLPDSLLGSAWPVMYQELGTSVSAAGIISMIISAGTIVSSLNSDRLNTRFGTGKVTAVSVLTTAVALFGFSISHSFWALCLWGIPYGLGAGSVDAALNNYVALHYKARHMSWLHCMWGVGCSTGPVVMRGNQSPELEQRISHHFHFPDCADIGFVLKPSSLAETCRSCRRGYLCSGGAEFFQSDPCSWCQRGADLLFLLLCSGIYCWHVGCKLLYAVPRY